MNYLFEKHVVVCFFFYFVNVVGNHFTCMMYVYLGSEAERRSAVQKNSHHQ